MKNIYFFLVAFFSGLACTVAQVSLTATGGTTSGSYTTLGAAFTAINAGTHTGTIAVSISANTTEAGPCVLNSTGAGTASYTSISIRPSADGVTISGATTTGRGLIELNGADNVTIDGDNPSTGGTNRNLTITNTAANTVTFTSVIRIVTGTGVTSADGNIIRNCIINGSATGLNVSGTTAGAVQNVMGIYGGGGATGATTAPAALAAVNTSGTTMNDLLINNNQINNCARAVSVNGAAITAINTLTVTNNTIGSSTALTGTPPYTTPSSTVYTVGITAQGVTTLIITGNTVQDIVSYSAQPVRAIEVVGTATTATIQNNIITGVVQNGASGTGSVNGVFFSGVTGTCDVSGNTITNIQSFTSSSLPAGISINNTATISKNKITTVYCRNTGTFGAHGINQFAGNNCVITNNFISDINYDISGGAAFNSTLGVAGIRLSAGTGHTLYHNSINLFGTFLGATAGTGVGSGCIQIASTTITGCTIRNNILSNSMTSASTSISATCLLFPASPTVSLNLTLNNNAYFQGTQANVNNIAHVGAIGGTRYLAANFNASAITPATNLRSLTSTLSAAGTNDNASLAYSTAPAFVSNTDLHLQTVAANVPLASGAPVGITTDIDGTTRSATTPVIGAHEVNLTSVPPVITYTALTNTCTAGDRTVTATVADANTGVPTTGGLVPRIYYRKNSGTWFSQPGTLTSGGSASGTWSFTILASDLGALTTSDVVSYYLIAQTNSGIVGSNPAAGLVASNVNTVTTPPTSPNTYVLLPALGGTYTVGASGTYTTITAAVSAYNSACLTGNVVFSLISSAYAAETLPITINGNSFASASATLTIRPAAGVTATVSGSSASAVFVLNGADYVTIDGSNSPVTNTVCPGVVSSRNLTVNNTSTSTTSAVIWLASISSNGARNNTVRNCNITGSSSTQTLIGIGSGGTAISVTSLGAGGDNNRFENNNISALQFGIYSSGASAASKNNGTVINQNLINAASPNNVSKEGIRVGFEDNITISGNMVANMSNTTSPDIFGIDVGFNGNMSATTITGNEVTNATITNNIIQNITNSGTFSASGLAVAAAATGTTLIANNLISGVSANGTAGDMGSGLVLGGGAGTLNVYYNTVVQNGAITGGSAGSSVSAALAVTATTAPVLNLLNNIFVNTQTPNAGGTTRFVAVGLGYTSTAGNYANLTSNNNDFYVAAGTNNFLTDVGGLVSGTTKATLAAWTTETGRDGASINFLPTFNSASDVHIQWIAANIPLGAGAVIAAITTDIDCATRSGTAPVIGADEVNMNAIPPTISYTTLVGTCSASDRTFTATISDPVSGVNITGTLRPRVYYRKNAGPWFSQPGTLTAGTSASGTWSFTILASDLAGLTTSDVVSYYVIAQTVAGYVGSNPSPGLAATDVNTVTTPPTSPNTYVLLPTLSGTYTVGTAGAYPTLTAAVNAYNTSCLGGPVTFVLTDALYSASETFPITINNSPFASPTLTLTIRPAAATAVSVTGTATSTAIFKLLNARFVTIDGINTGGASLTLNNANTGNNTADIWLASSGAGCTDIALKNMTLNGGIGNSTTNWGIDAAADGASPSGTAAADIDNITIQGNTIKKCGYAIRAVGTAATSAGGLDNWNILNNIMGPAAYSATDNIGYNGMFLQSMLNATVTGNTMQNVGYNTGAATWQIAGMYMPANINGIVISGNNFNNMVSSATGTGTGTNIVLYLGTTVTNATITGNNIQSISNIATGGYGARAIEVNTGVAASNITIANNFISDLYGYSNTTNGNWPVGIAVEGTSGGVKIYYNSINLSGSHTGLNAATGSACLLVTTSGNGLDVRDNIFVNTYDNNSSATDKGWAIYSTVASSVFSVIDYNDYYVAAPNVLGNIGGTDRVNLAGIQAGFGGNVNSLNFGPTFVSAVNLHLQNASANLTLAAGTPVAGVTTDIDGTTRSGVNPVIGAHELILPPCSGTPTAGTISPSVASACGPFTTLLSTVGTTGALGLTYQWANSPDNVTFTDIPGATAFTYTASVPTSIYYRMTVTCTTSAASNTTPGYQLLVNTPPTAIGGASSVCLGSTVTLSNGVTGGTWSSSNGAIATAGSSSGVVSGVAGGVVMVTYTLASGCNTTTPVQVYPYPSLGASASPATICSGTTSTVTATSAVTNYTVYPAVYNPISFTAATTITSVTPLSGGNTDDGFYTVAMPFSFSFYGTSYSSLNIGTNGYVNFGAGATVFSAVAIPSASDPANGVMLFMRDLTMGSTGIIRVGTVGTAPNRKFVIEYSVPNLSSGGPNNGQIVFYESLNQIDMMVSSVPVNTNITSWGVQNSAGTIGAAVPGRNGVAYGIAAPEAYTFVWPQASVYAWTPATGLSSTTIANPVSTTTTTVTYTVTGSYGGCATTASTLLSVNPTPVAIAGTTVACVGSTSAMTDATPGGAWASSVPAVATVNATGVVTGVSAGTTLISYTINGCSATVIFTVNTSPGAFGGTPVVCTGVSTTLTNAGGPGSWNSSNAAVATVGTASGIVAGLTAGTTVISYVNGCGTTVTTIFTVNQTPAAITGSTSCAGSSNTLSTTTPGGTWTSSNTAVATIGSSTGVVNGVAAGAAFITYTLGNGCVNQTRLQLVNPAPPVAVTTSPATICAGGTSTLTATSTVTNYTVLPTAYAPVAFTPTGTFAFGSAVSGGTLDDGYFTVSLPFDLTYYGVTYTAGTNVYIGTNGYLTFGSGPTTISIGTMPSTSFPATIAFFGRDLNLNTGGNITYGTTGTAPNRQFVISYNNVPDFSTGVLENGQMVLTETTSQIDFHINTAQTSNHTFGVQNATATVFATAPGQNNSTTAVTNSSWSFVWPQASSYTWTPASSLSNSAISNPVASPTTTVTYTVLGTYAGCSTAATQQVSVNPLPAPITGIASVCAGLTTSLASATPGGTWVSSNPATGSINTSGVVSGITAGTTTVSYTLTSTGCRITRNVTVNPLPAAIGGTASVCEGLTTTLTDADPGGTWTGSATSIATIDPSTGVLTGVYSGFAPVTYTLPTSCMITAQATVNAVPAVGVTPSPVPAICFGNTASIAAVSDMHQFALLSQDFNTGIGAWTFNNVAGSAASYWQIVTPPGYSGEPGDGTPMLESASDAFAGATSTMLVSPSFSTVGYGSVSVSFNEYLISLTSADAIVAVEYSTDGGTVWSNVNDQLGAAVGSGAWTSSSPEVTTALPAAALGQPNVKLRWNYYSVQGLWWAIDNIKITAAQPAPSYVWSGVSGATGLSCTACTSVDVTPSAVGSNVYSVQGTTTAGCIGSTTVTVTVNPLPSAIGGTLAVCPGRTTTATDADAGGTWSIAGSSIATVASTTGIITGVSAGTTVITYTLPTGCIITDIVTVNPLPVAITGVMQVCPLLTTTLSDTDPGGTWSSGSLGRATIDVNGVVTGVSAGTASITYTLPTGCITSSLVTVNPLPAPIGGIKVVCEGRTTTLNDADAGGTWTSGAATIADVAATTGIVSGFVAGTAPITYTFTSTGCYISTNVTVNPLPAAISGTPQVCIGATTTLTDVDAGGTWASSTPGIASIASSTGVVSGVSMGTATITYTLPTSCPITTVMTVDPLPAPITGPAALCVNGTGTFGDGTPGGTWTSSTPLVATIDNITGVATAMGAGTTLITYTSAAGCMRIRPLTVNPLPLAITGPTEVCKNGTITLADATAGGTWSSSTVSVATIDVAGVLSGVSNGVTSIVYTLTTGCTATASITVNPLPLHITGTTNVCLGQTTTLSSATPGGTWSSGAPATALVGVSTGVVTGVGVGSTLISYTLPTGCSRTAAVAVNAMPSAISGATNVCQGSTTVMSTASTGGVWTSSTTSVASINLTSGIVTGLAAGTTDISYTIVAGSCSVTYTITVDAMPSALTGSHAVCNGQSTALSSTPAGGTWSSSNATVATVGTSGLVAGVATGTSAISYTLSSGCMRSAIITVNALPSVYAVTGGGNYCAGGSGVHIGLDGSNGGVNYQLSSGTGLIGSPVTGVTGLPLDFGFITPAGSYSVTATAASTGCSSNMTGSATVGITAAVPAAVSFNTNTGTDTVCSAGATFTAAAVNGGTIPVYQWKVNSVIVPGATASTYSYVPASGDVVTVNMSSSIACATPTTATAARTLAVTASVMPVAGIAVTPGTNLCQGNTATFSASALFGGTAPVFIWMKNGATATTGSSYTYTPANGDNVYVKLVSNHACSLADTVSSSNAIMTVSPLYSPVVDITADPGTVVQSGTTVTLTAHVTGGGPSPSFQWSIGPVVITGATNSTFSYSVINNGDSVSCLVTGTGACGVPGSRSVILHVAPAGITVVTPGMGDIRLMPNPNKGEFTVKGTLSVKADKEVAIEVTNMLGQVVYRTSITARNGNIDEQIKLDHTLANGMYMLNMVADNDRKVFHFVLEQ